MLLSHKDKLRRTSPNDRSSMEQTEKYTFYGHSIYICSRNH